MTRKHRSRSSAGLRAWIVASGRSQADVARTIGIDPGHLSRLLSGRARPSLDLAVRLEGMTAVPAAGWAVTS